MDIQAANRKIAGGCDLSRAEMQDVTREIMRGVCTDAQIGAFLTALHMKGESVEEIVGAAMIMREFAAAVAARADKIVDCVGTGGDTARLFNVSTASALVAAAAGGCVAKHGNRAATSHCGSADVLEAAGVNIGLAAAQVGACIDACGIGFLFAPTHHSATRYVMPARREIGLRTIFNLLGPLTNPAGARYQLVGVFAQKWVRPVAEVLRELGSVRAVVVCADDGLDEISIAADTFAAELRGGEIYEYTITPNEFGIRQTSLADIRVNTAAESLAMVKKALTGAPGPAFDMVALNAGATLYAAEICDSIAAGVARARAILQSGAAWEKLQELAAYTTRV